MPNLPNLKLIEFARITEETVTVKRVDPPLILKSRTKGIMVLEQICFSRVSPLVLVMPSFNGLDCHGDYFRIDLDKGPQFMMDRPPTPLNPKAKSAIYSFCRAVAGLIENPQSRVGVVVRETPELSLEN